jgi:hypothetical protein
MKNLRKNRNADGKVVAMFWYYFSYSHFLLNNKLRVNGRFPALATSVEMQSASVEVKSYVRRNKEELKNGHVES